MPTPFELLQAVNGQVNRSVSYRTDLDQYGVIEKWAYPASGYGDCEDYALMKRKRLIDAGLDPATLNIATCWDENNEGHAVLVAALPGGDYVLDNHTDEVRQWSLVHYRWDRISVGGSFREWKKVI